MSNYNLFRDKGDKDREIWDELNGVFNPNPYLTILKAKLSRWLIILDAMLDIGVSRLPVLYLHGGMEKEFHEFVLILNRSNTHLKELSMIFQVQTYLFTFEY